MRAAITKPTRIVESTTHFVLKFHGLGNTPSRVLISCCQSQLDGLQDNTFSEALKSEDKVISTSSIASKIED